MFGKQSIDKLSAYAGEFVPTTNGGAQASRPARQRRGSDPTISASAPRTEENDADRRNPRLPYQLQPNSRPRVRAQHEPYPGSPAAALLPTSLPARNAAIMVAFSNWCDPTVALSS